MPAAVHGEQCGVRPRQGTTLAPWVSTAGATAAHCAAASGGMCGRVAARTGAAGAGLAVVGSKPLLSDAVSVEQQVVALAAGEWVGWSGERLRVGGAAAPGQEPSCLTFSPIPPCRAYLLPLLVTSCHLVNVRLVAGLPDRVCAAGQGGGAASEHAGVVGGQREGGQPCRGLPRQSRKLPIATDRRHMSRAHRRAEQGWAPPL